MNPISPGSAIPILGAPDPRQIKLQRMRDKLAGNSEKEIHIQQMRDRVRTRMVWSRGWRLLAMAAIIGLSWLAFGLRNELGFIATPKKLTVLSAPEAKMGADQELLFWTYALYDMKRFRKEFGIGKKTLVDARLARTRISELMPKAGPKAVFTARMYQTNRGRIK